MGHAVTIFDYSEKVNRRLAWEDVNEFCRANCDPWEYGGYIDDVMADEITWKDDRVFPDFRAAKEFLHDYRLSHPYEPIAVRYRGDGKVTKRTADLEERAERLRSEVAMMERKALPMNRTSNLIGCPACGSKISRKHLGDGWLCPVCRGDLRAPSAVKAIGAKWGRIGEAEKLLRESRIRDGQRAPIRWAVIAEVHC